MFAMHTRCLLDVLQVTQRRIGGSCVSDCSAAVFENLIGIHTRAYLGKH
jgi:hypothetical protein